MGIFDAFKKSETEVSEVNTLGEEKEVAENEGDTDEVAITAENATAISTEIGNYDVPEEFEGKAVTSIVGLKKVGEQMFVQAYCDDRCMYDIPVTLKS